ncbi:MAG: gamma-glutamyltransferase family protein, partial [Pseudomonadota bacterium]
AEPSRNSVGVPGLVRALARMHSQHGRLPWRVLFEPAITLATDGFELSPRLFGLLSWMGSDRFAPEARAYFFDADGAPKAIGTRLTNLAYARTLRLIATEGPRAFYEGRLARAMVDRIAQAPERAGDMSVDDLKAYRAVVRPPVCSAYRAFRVCGMGPPSSGALTVAQTLALVAPLLDAGTRADALRPSWVHIIAEAQKLAFADRGRYIADPDVVAVPATLLDPGYIAERRALIDRRRTATDVQPGLPPGVKKRSFGVDGSIESAGTSQISVVDRDGNAVSMTSSIESAFGARMMVGGFLLNNQLTDFSFRPTDDAGVAIANRVASGKRPRSSMAPTLIFRPDGELFAALGSPGGSRIILYVTKAIVALIDWELDAQEAAALPNFGSRGGPLELEIPPIADRLTALLDRLARRAGVSVAPRRSDQMALPAPIVMKGYGHRIRPARMTSGLQIIVRRDDGLEGGADPRREGVARGR